MTLVKGGQFMGTHDLLGQLQSVLHLQQVFDDHSPSRQFRSIPMPRPFVSALMTHRNRQSQTRSNARWACWNTKEKRQFRGIRSSQVSECEVIS